MSTLTKILITFTLLMCLAITLSSTPTQKSPLDIEDEKDENIVSNTPSARFGRFLAQQPKGLMKCNKNPRLCRAKGSPGPDCCNKKCVNVKTDKQNCGLCGRKCKHMEICCKGSCVNPMVNKRHCGGCNYVCKRGNSCVRGMCSYA
ncbi:putative stigma-specific protein Stig1 [Helianthus debilis subsp. tardiflorus]